MSKDITLTIDRISETDEQECRIDAPGQIAAILRDIAEAGSNAALYYNSRWDFIMTTILDIDEDGFWIEQGHNAEDNRHVTASNRLTLVCSHNHIKVEFVVNKASNASYDNRPAFFLPLPDHLYRLQRREYFRLSLPQSEHLHFTIDIVHQSDTGRQSQTIRRKVPVADISGGGVGLLCLEDESDFVPGRTYTNCKIDLPDIGPIQVTIKVVNIVSLAPNKFGKTLRRAGCSFGAIDSHTQSKLQRYITDKQRQMATLETAKL